VSALVRDGMTVLSTQQATGGTCGPKDGIMRAYAGASTRWNPLVGGAVMPVSETLRDIRTQIGRCGFAVVMMHPQEFAFQNGSTNPSSFSSLAALLQAVEDDDSMEAAFFSELTDGPIPPPHPTPNPTPGPPKPLSKIRCGDDWTHANSICGVDCSSTETDAPCPGGQKCFDHLSTNACI